MEDERLLGPKELLNIWGLQNYYSFNQRIRAFAKRVAKEQLAKVDKLSPDRERIAECFYYYHGWDGETKWEDVSGEDRGVYYDFADQILSFIDKEAIEKAEKPKVVCLCGSTRFVDTFNEWRKRLTLEGKIVVSIELVLPQTEREDPQHSNFKVKQALDELHLRKIDLADEVMILNIGGYIGESTSKEVAYAEKLGKPIIYLENPISG